MARFILVHGAAHGGWCWRRLAHRLRREGHRVDAPDLPGAGDDPADPADVTGEDYLARVLEVMGPGDEPVLLVGHSMGGVTVSRVAEECPQRLAAAVYVTAFMLGDGERVRDITLLDPAPAVLDAIDFEGDPRVYRYRPDAARALFYDDCAPADADDAVRRLRPMPRVIAQTPLRCSDGRGGQVRRVFVQCHADRAIPLSLQRRMCERLPTTRVIGMDCGHSPFLAAPGVLAAHLDSLAGETGAGER